jgi:hypothetical protein
MNQRSKSINMNNLNIVYDFTQNESLNELLEEQPVAVIPAELAKRLLKAWAQNLVKVPLVKIVGEHIDDLDTTVQKKGNTMDDVVHVSLSFIQERQLIQACANENWDMYAVDTVDDDKKLQVARDWQAREFPGSTLDDKQVVQQFDEFKHYHKDLYD